jgi:hypothetical protein
MYGSFSSGGKPMNSLRGRRVVGLLGVIALVWSLGAAPPARAGSGETNLAIGVLQCGARVD